MNKWVLKKRELEGFLFQRDVNLEMLADLVSLNQGILENAGEDLHGGLWKGFSRLRRDPDRNFPGFSTQGHFFSGN